MLLEGRFFLLRFYMGVRITVLVDETRYGRHKVWGWAYETLSIASPFASTIPPGESA